MPLRCFLVCLIFAQAASQARHPSHAPSTKIHHVQASSRALEPERAADAARRRRALRDGADAPLAPAPAFAPRTAHQAACDARLDVIGLERMGHDDAYIKQLAELSAFLDNEHAMTPEARVRARVTSRRDVVAPARIHDSRVRIYSRP